MTSYITSLAHTFDGSHIDNCHSTPFEVGTALLDAMRAVRPDPYVCAVFFTGSEEMDLAFVRELGVNSLIKESGNGHNMGELSRLIYRHRLGKPIGLSLNLCQSDCLFPLSMDGACLTSTEELPPSTGKGSICPCPVSPPNISPPHIAALRPYP